MPIVQDHTETDLDQFHPLGSAPSPSAIETFSGTARTNLEEYRKIKAYLRDPNLKAAKGNTTEIKLRSKALKEYELRNNALYFTAGKNNQRVVLKHDVFDVIAHTHDALMQAGDWNGPAISQRPGPYRYGLESRNGPEHICRRGEQYLNIGYGAEKAICPTVIMARTKC
ncbi:hypothetical protein EV426DRAFT_577688 [Tirmania nivea]|nr:hypothetical protein EV426DRAFT_577688 [Tirmania nivea]